MATPSGFEVKSNPWFVPRYWCWVWLRGHTNQVSGCTNLWNWSESASGAHAVLPLSTRALAWNLFWTFLGTSLDICGLSDSCGGFDLQIHDRFQASMLICLTFVCCATQSAVSNNIPISGDFCRVVETHSEAYYAKLLVLPWNQSWDYSFESLPMLTVLEDQSNFGDWWNHKHSWPWHLTFKHSKLKALFKPGSKRFHEWFKMI